MTLRLSPNKLLVKPDAPASPNVWSPVEQKPFVGEVVQSTSPHITVGERIIFNYQHSAKLRIGGELHLLFDEGDALLKEL